MSIEDGKIYKIINIKSDTVLAGEDDSIVGCWEKKDKNNQNWLLKSEGDFWTLKNESNGRFLGIAEDPWPGASIKLGTTQYFEWKIRGMWEWGEGVYRIFYAHASVPLNVELSKSGSPENGTGAILWGERTETNQLWRFIEVEGPL